MGRVWGGTLGPGAPSGDDPLVDLPERIKSRTRGSGADEGVRPTALLRHFQLLNASHPVEAGGAGVGRAPWPWGPLWGRPPGDLPERIKSRTGGSGADEGVRPTALLRHFQPPNASHPVEAGIEGGDPLDVVVEHHRGMNRVSR